MAYKTFANGFPLPASDLNNFLMNQSVIVFADSAARTTAIPSPVEGMLTYLEDTNVYEGWTGAAWVNINDNTDAILKSTVTTAEDLIVADGASSVTRLGVGTDDQVLTVVSGEVAWADAGGGGGSMTQISTGSITGVTTISSIPQTYRDLYIFVSAGGGDIRINGATSGYKAASFATYNTNWTKAIPAAAVEGFSPTVSNQAYSARFTEYTGGKSKNYNFQGKNGTNYIFGFGYLEDTAAITSLVFSSASNSGGTYFLYGVN